jgi:SOS response regulatory protein OraA/RecX
MFALIVRSAAAPLAFPRLHVRSYTRRSVPTNIDSYLMNFALAYLSQRSTSEKHLEFVLRRRMTNLKFRSERAAESRAKFIKTQQTMGLKPTFPSSRFPTKKAAETPESTVIANHAIDDAVNKVLTHFRSNGVLNDEKYSQKRASMLRAQSRSARYIQLDLTKKARPSVHSAVNFLLIPSLTLSFTVLGCISGHSTATYSACNRFGKSRKSDVGRRQHGRNRPRTRSR